MVDAPAPPRPTAELVVQGATEILTVPASGGLGIMSGAVVAIGSGRILGVGERHDVAATIDLSTADVVDVDGGVVAPGYVDAHTHLVFGGARVDEYAARVARDDEALERLRDAGSIGILATVTATRAASAADLRRQAAARLHDMLEHGTTTVESKSGYGLTTASEVRILEVSGELDRVQPVRVVSTFLGGHAFPPEETREAYVERLTGEMLDEVARRELAAFCDVYCDDGYFSVDETERILEAGLRAGLRPKVHLDAYSHTGAAAIAARLGAVSVDHLNFTTGSEAEALARAGVIGVIMPALDLMVAHDRPCDARTLIDAGLTLALATDVCPACWTTSMTLVVQLACRRAGLTIEEAIRAATFGGAAAVGLDHAIGSLEPGRRADLQVWAVPDHRHLAYRFGANPVSLVIVGGEIVVDRRAELSAR